VRPPALGDKLTNRIGSDLVPRAVFSGFGGKSKKKSMSSNISEPFLEAIANVCNTISGICDVNFIIAPHIHSDFGVTKDFFAATRKISDPRYLAGSRLEVAGVLRGTKSASGYFDLYRQADYVIGMRGHSMIVSVGVGTPCVGIVSHPKVEGFLKDCCLEKWSTNISNVDLEGSLLEKIHCLMDDSSEWKELRAVAFERMVERRKIFHCEVKRLLQ